MPKAKVSEFTRYIRSKVGSAYLWGGQGESLFSLLRKLAKQNGQSDAKTEQTIAFMKSKGIKDIEVFDCSGLSVSYFLSVGAISGDMTADAIYRKCKKISKGEIREGDMAFLLNSSGKATHIGYMVDKKTVVHALNQSRGVIEEDVNQRKWVFGRPEFCLEYDLKEPKTEVADLKPGDKITLSKAMNGYNTAANALAAVNPVVPYPAGEYYVYKVYGKAVNITKKKGTAGAWVVL